MKDYDVIADTVKHIEDLIAEIRLDIKDMRVENKAKYVSVASKNNSVSTNIASNLDSINTKLNNIKWWGIVAVIIMGISSINEYSFAWKFLAWLGQ